ncbi:MAG: Rrf2 family transcriptional regulator [Rhodospirillales bacterium]|nr:Rrf2 family transcriptional regulator [Rhodospirillales bacterium]
MIGLSNKLVCAIAAVCDVATNVSDFPVRSSEINGRQGISPRYLEAALQELVKAGILAGIRGRQGGYRLMRDPKDISLAQIAAAVASTYTGVDPRDINPSSPLGQEVVRPLFHDLAAKWMKNLDKISIEQLCAQAREPNARRAVRAAVRPRGSREKSRYARGASPA